MPMRKQRQARASRESTLCARTSKHCVWRRPSAPARHTRSIRDKSSERPQSHRLCRLPCHACREAHRLSTECSRHPRAAADSRCARRGSCRDASHPAHSSFKRTRRADTMRSACRSEAECRAQPTHARCSLSRLPKRPHRPPRRPSLPAASRASLSGSHRRQPRRSRAIRVAASRPASGATNLGSRCLKVSTADSSRERPAGGTPPRMHG
eukprot:scaffold20310_cov125-Isochrysis_galbana.AAC.7